MTLPDSHPHAGLAHRLTKTMASSKGATPHTSHASRIMSMSTPSEAPEIGGEGDEQTKAQRLAELRMQNKRLEKENERLRDRITNIARMTDLAHTWTDADDPVEHIHEVHSVAVDALNRAEDRHE